MDASKTGLRVKIPVFKEDKQRWASKKPWYIWKLEQGKSVKNGSEKSVLKREDSQFILDALVEEGERLRKEVLQSYRRLKVQSGEEEDLDLARPWNTAKVKAAQAKSQGIFGFAENLEDIENHVKGAYKGYLRAVVISQGTGAEAQLSKDGHYDKVASSFAKPPAFRGFAFFSDDDVQILKASFASTQSLTFAFSVAFRDLCAIKARAIGNASITHQFAQSITVPNVVTRMLSQAHSGDTSM